MGLFKIEEVFSLDPTAVAKIKFSGQRDRLVAVEGNDFFLSIQARSKGEVSTRANFAGQIFRLIINGIKPTFVFGLTKGKQQLQPEQLQFCLEVLIATGIPFFQGTFDSLSKCISLLEDEEVHAVGSDNKEAVLYGAMVVLTNLSSKTCVTTQYNLEKFLNDFELTYYEFVDLAILVGCSKCRKVKNIDPQSALNLIQEYRNLNKISKAKVINLQPYFMYQKARAHYKAQRSLKGVQTAQESGNLNRDKLLEMNLWTFYENMLTSHKKQSKTNPKVSKSSNSDHNKTPAAQEKGLVLGEDGSLLWVIVQNQVHHVNLSTSFVFDANKPHILKKIDLYKPDRDIKINSLIDLTQGDVDVTQTDGIEYTLRCQKSEIGTFSIVVRFTFRVEETEKLMYQVFNTRVINEDIKGLEPKVPYTKPKRRNFRKPCFQPIPGLSWGNTKSSFKEALKLNTYPMNPTVRKLLDAGFPKSDPSEELATEFDLNQSRLNSELSWDVYKFKLNLLLTCEEYQMKIDIRTYDMKSAILTKDRPNLLSLVVPGLLENRPSLLRGDRIFASIYQGKNSEPEDQEYEGIVHEIQQNTILVGFSKALMKRFVPNMHFHIRFTISRYPMRTTLRAVDLVPKHEIAWKDLLFPVSQNQPSQPQVPSLVLFNRIIDRNDKQKTAVANILAGGIPGMAYIIFGPPGTGKTITMVEAIKQVWKNKPVAKILVSAPSNAAADLLASRLLDHIPPSKIIRFYASSRDENSVPVELRKISNFEKVASNYNDLLPISIIVTTLVTSSKMVSAGFPENHFSHFFIDEAGQATEPETLIPISGLLFDPKKAQLILAGDPKQLGPVIRSPIASQYGLETSLLERFMLRDVYKPNKDHLYNEKCITKLCINFRSHPKLLELSSKLFYHSQLVAQGDPGLINAMINWEHLPKKGFPMIFHGIQGQDQREEESPSFFNLEEASIVVNYVEKLLTDRQKGMQKIDPKDIGIISPYRRQVVKIKELMNKRFQRTIPNWNEMTVGSTEMFQGQERKIIIISTVRSQVELIKDDFVFKLGFLNNPKRFNVAITRMKALLIVVGNPSLLSVDPCWKELITFAKQNGGFVCKDSSDASLKEMLLKFKKLNLDQDAILSHALHPQVLQDLSQAEASEAVEWKSDDV